METAERENVKQLSTTPLNSLRTEARHGRPFGRDTAREIIVKSPVFINAGQRFGLRAVKMREEQIGSGSVCTNKNGRVATSQFLF